jgi:hypothetical protein
MITMTGYEENTYSAAQAEAGADQVLQNQPGKIGFH